MKAPMDYKDAYVLKLESGKHWGLSLGTPSLWVEVFQKGREEVKGEKGEKQEREQSPGCSASSLENVATKHGLKVGTGGEVERWKAQGSRKEDDWSLSSMRDLKQNG